MNCLKIWKGSSWRQIKNRNENAKLSFEVSVVQFVQYIFSYTGISNYTKFFIKCRHGADQKYINEGKT